jgi:hypothetical protein
MRCVGVCGLLAIVLVAGCGDDGDGGQPANPEVSSECLEAMDTAAAELDPDRADPLIIETLSACSSADEWLAALEERPGAMGLTERATIDDGSLEVACFADGAAGTPVCDDAEADGRLS